MAVTETHTHRTRAEIMALVNAAEAEFAVDEWRLNGLRIWPILRIVMFVQLFYQSRQATASPARAKGLEKVRLAAKVTKCYVGDWRHNVYSADAAEAVFLTYDVHRQKLGSIWYDRFCDRFVDELDALGWRSLVYELSGSGDLADCRIPRHRSSVFVQPMIEAAIVAARAVELYRPSAVPFWYDALTDWCSRREIVNVLPSFLQLSTAARAVDLLANWFERRLTALGTKVVFAVQYYHLLGYAANVACRRLGIPSVDIQHGVQGDYHSAYGSWQCVPAGGYEVLPSVFWCWSDVEAEAINRWATRTEFHRTFVGGDLWLSNWREIVEARAPIAPEALAALKPKGAKLVLFSSSYSNDITDWIVAAIRRSPPDVRWAVRLHPSYLQFIDVVSDRLRAEGLPNVNVRLASQLPLPVVLGLADVNVTSGSTVVIEAAKLGVPSVITDPTALDMYADLVRSGWVTSAFTTEALLAAVAQHCEGPRTIETAPEGECANGSLLRLLSVLESPAPRGASCS